jgi:hypothetical protein
VAELALRRLLEAYAEFLALELLKAVQSRDLRRGIHAE